MIANHIFVQLKIKFTCLRTLYEKYVKNSCYLKLNYNSEEHLLEY